MAAARSKAHIDLSKFPLKQVAPVAIDSHRATRNHHGSQCHPPPKSQGMEKTSNRVHLFINFAKNSQHSLVLASELSLRELLAKHPKAPSRERIRGVFKVLDDLAISNEALRIISEEFKVAVYATELVTSSSVSNLSDDNGNHAVGFAGIEAIPYFEAFERADQIR